MGMPGIVIQIGADTKDAIDGINKVNDALGDQLTGAQKFKGAVDKAFLPAVGALAALGAAGWEFSKAAMEDQKAAAILETQLRKNTGATDAQVAATEDWIAAQGKALGIADDQLRPALGKLAQATGDVAKAQELASLSLDLSAATGVSAEAAAKALAKAYGGSTGALSKLLPGIDAAILKSGDFAAIQAEVQKKVGGTAATIAGTAAGQIQRFQVAIDETKESIGAALLPIIEKVLPYITQLGDWATEHTGVFLAIGGAIGAIAAAIVILKIAMEAWTVVQWALNSALLANPITWIVLAIVGLIAIVVLAYKKFDWFRNFIDAVWSGIQTAISVVVQWFQDTVWPILQRVIGFIVAYYQFLWTAIKTVWDFIYGIIEKVVTWFRDNIAPIIKDVVQGFINRFNEFKVGVKIVWDAVMEYIGPVVKWLQDKIGPAITAWIDALKLVWEGLKTGISTVWDGIKSAIQTAWRIIEPIVSGMWNFIQKIVDGIKVVSSWWAGNGNTGTSTRAAVIAPTMSSGAVSVGGATVININMGVGDPVAIRKEISNILRTSTTRVGVSL